MTRVSQLSRFNAVNTQPPLFIFDDKRRVISHYLFNVLRNVCKTKLRVLSVLTFCCGISACTPQDKKEASPASQAINSNQQASSQNTSQMSASEMFFKNTMNAAPFLPSNTEITLDFALAPVNGANQQQYLTSSQTNYADYGWEQRIAHNWSFFDMPASHGKVLLIDIKDKNTQPAYRYLANAETQHDLYEPWSSSKIFAFTGAMAKLRKDHANILANEDKITRIGEHHTADLITSINSYEQFGLADGNSNAIATFFANIATRDLLTDLFYEQWLKLSTPNIYFRGAYGPVAFAPKTNTFVTQNANKKQAFSWVETAAEDPGYLPYRCENCGLTGNKPMTTLAQAEWLKRLATHLTDPAFAHPYLQQSDINTLFYGEGHSQTNTQFAGMTLGISTMLQKALARNINAKQHNKVKNAPYTTDDILASPLSADDAKHILDTYSDGNWRVFQKIGWGPSETRSTAENVVLAYVYLPNKSDPQNNLSFVIAAQTSVPEAKDENVALAGLKMEALLSNSMKQYLDSN